MSRIGGIINEINNRTFLKERQIDNRFIDLLDIQRIMPCRDAVIEFFTILLCSFLYPEKLQRSHKLIYESDARTVRTKFSMDPSTHRFKSSRSRIAFDQLSSITDFQRSRLPSQLPAAAKVVNRDLPPKRRILTKKSLKEFEKTPQGE